MATGRCGSRGRELVETFVKGLRKSDLLFMPEPYYAGGTVDRSVGSREIVSDLKAAGLGAQVFATRDEILPAIVSAVKAGDRVLIMARATILSLSSPRKS